MMRKDNGQSEYKVNKVQFDKLDISNHRDEQKRKKTIRKLLVSIHFQSADFGDDDDDEHNASTQILIDWAIYT